MEKFTKLAVPNNFVSKSLQFRKSKFFVRRLTKISTKNLKKTLKLAKTKAKSGVQNLTVRRLFRKPAALIELCVLVVKKPVLSVVIHGIKENAKSRVI